MMRPYVRDSGSGPTVVLLHAGGANSGQWRALTERLSGRFRVLACDMSGSGRSPAFPHDATYTLDEELRFLEPVFEAAGEEFHVVGHSYGGAVAIKAALHHGTRVRSLTLFEPVLFSLLVEAAPRGAATREILGLAQSTTDSAERGDFDAGAREFIDYWFGAGRWASMREEARAPILATMNLTGARWGAVFDDPARLADLRRIDTPALVLYAQHTRAPARALSALLGRTLPNARSVEIDGVGHMAPLVNPDAVNPLIESFLAEVGSMVSVADSGA
ncbi:MAG: alpha/beta hydrolase [Proteobacteria bacterium]|nr:alpha/beta hydrolase [Pseudomonadota bacterium]